MRSAWSEQDAKATIDHYGTFGIGPELALRVYSTRLLGRDPKLVLHGGGNTSVKLTARELTGTAVPALHIKGSGWDMAAIEPAGMPAVRLEPLLTMRARDRLNDDDMARVLRSTLIDPQAPSPSVETLLHAFIPAKAVDHTHATAVLSLIDQADTAKLCNDIYGARMSVVPYIMPGFALAKAAADAVRQRSKDRGPDPRQAWHLHLRRRCA